LRSDGYVPPPRAVHLKLGVSIGRPKSEKTMTSSVGFPSNFPTEDEQFGKVLNHRPAEGRFSNSPTAGESKRRAVR
jgi:hypothetical protein